MIKISDEELLAELRRRFSENKKTVDELNRINKILTKVNNSLSEAEAMKSHFISNISNEIVNPFTSILALSKSILETDKENWKKVISMVSMIHSEAFNLDFQFKNIFAAAKIEAGEISVEMTRTMITAVVNDVIESFRYEAEKKKLSVMALFNDHLDEENRYFITDSEKLRLVISNLISNAIKYSKENGLIELNCSLDGRKLVIEVRDYGNGISKKDQEIIFNRFIKLDSSISSINKGHGLGLSVVKALIELLSSDISVVSAPGKGASFTVIIPEWEGEVEGTTLFGSELFFEEDQL